MRYLFVVRFPHIGFALLLKPQCTTNSNRLTCQGVIYILVLSRINMIAHENAINYCRKIQESFSWFPINSPTLILFLFYFWNWIQLLIYIDQMHSHIHIIEGSQLMSQKVQLKHVQQQPGCSVKNEVAILYNLWTPGLNELKDGE